MRTLTVHDLLFVAGHGPDVTGQLQVRGRVGGDLTVEQGALCAEHAMLNILHSKIAEVSSTRVDQRAG